MTTQWIAAIGPAIAIGCAASLYVLTVQRRRDEARAGSVAPAAVSWRRLIGMPLQAMRRRGYVQAVDLENAAGDRDHMLQRDSARWLLPCTQASTSAPGGDVTCIRSASSRRSPDEQPVALSWTCPALAWRRIAAVADRVARVLKARQQHPLVANADHP